MNISLKSTELKILFTEAKKVVIKVWSLKPSMYVIICEYKQRYFAEEKLFGRKKVIIYMYVWRILIKVRCYKFAWINESCWFGKIYSYIN